jgi:hypothetical protein
MPGLPDPQVTVNGWPCSGGEVLGQDSIRAIVPAEALSDPTKAPIHGKVEVQTFYNVTTVYDKARSTSQRRRVRACGTGQPLG